MFWRKVVKPPPKLIWRLSGAQLAGTYILADARGRTPVARDGAHESGFHGSTLDLLNGADVSETELDSLPGDLVDAFAPVSR